MTGALRTPAITTVCLLLALHAPGQAAEKPVKLGALPRLVQTTMREQSKGAKILGTSSEVEGGKTMYELETLANGHHEWTPRSNPAQKRKTPPAPKRLRGNDLRFMGLGRVELPTSRLSGVRSNHLSYRPCRLNV